MKKQTNNKAWLVWLIIALVLFLFSLPLVMMLVTDPESEVKQLFAGLLAMGSMVAFAMMIRSFVKLTREKTMANFKEPEAESFSEVTEEKIPVNSVNVSKKLLVKTYTYNTDDSESVCSWGLVFLWFIIGLAPVGIYYFIRKLLNEKYHIYENGLMSLLLGIVLIIFFSPMMIIILIESGFSDLFGAGLIFSVQTIIGIILIVCGIVYMHKGKQNAEYMIIITNERITNIDEISKRMKTTYAKSSRIIQDLIENGFLKKAYIYHKDREVIVPGISKKIALKCNNCTGTTVLYSNEEHICEYCGAKL